MFTYHYKYSHYSKSNNNYNTEIIMFWYNEDDPDVIISCSFDGINIADLDPNEIFREGSTWANCKLLYKPIKAYAALAG